MINIRQLSDYVIKPALELVGDTTHSSLHLLLGTAAAESRVGTYLHQINGPACGIYQMEPATLDDLLENYVLYRQNRFADFLSVYPPSVWYPERLIYDLQFATGCARLHYYRVPEPLPTTVSGHAEYWKTHYNTYKGKGTIPHYLAAYKELVAPHIEI